MGGIFWSSFLTNSWLIRIFLQESKQKGYDFLTSGFFCEGVSFILKSRSTAKFHDTFFGKMTIGRILSPTNTIIPSLDDEVSFKEQGNWEDHTWRFPIWSRVDECWVGNLLGIRLVPLLVDVHHSITQSPMSHLA